MVLHGCRNLDAWLFELHIQSELRFKLAHSGINFFLHLFSESGVWTGFIQTGEIVRLLNWFSHPYRGSRSTIPAYLTDRLFLLFYRSIWLLRLTFDRNTESRTKNIRKYELATLPHLQDIQITAR